MIRFAKMCKPKVNALWPAFVADRPSHIVSCGTGWNELICHAIFHLRKAKLIHWALAAIMRTPITRAPVDAIVRLPTTPAPD